MTTQINLDLLWALTGGVTDPGDVNYEAGWEAEIPTFQEFNFVLKNLCTNLLVMAEQGKFDWQTEITYAVGATVVEAGQPYYCITAHSAQQPTTDVTNSYWVTGSKLGAGATSLVQQLGLLLDEVNTRTATTWDGNDITLNHANSLVSLMTSNVGTKNWLLGNVSGELVAVDVGTTLAPDNRSIALAEALTHRLFHEGHPPTQSEVSGTIADALSNGKIYARQDANWVEVTATEVSVEPPPPVAGNGSGWYNLDDGQLYVDVDDGDSSQWVMANAPVIPKDVIPAGTSMLFMQAAAPVGWTKSVTHNNKALRIVSGTGGGSGGSNTFTGALNATHSHTVTVSSHILSLAEMPAHRHLTGVDVDAAALLTASNSYSRLRTGNYTLGGSSSEPAIGRTSSVGSNSGHNHTASGGSTNLDVQYVDSIICIKD